MVEISLPSLIQIELVQGNELRHYEIFSWLASGALSVAVGFWTALATVTAESANKPLLGSAIAFTGLMLFSIGIAHHYRSKMYNGKIKKAVSFDKFG